MLIRSHRGALAFSFIEVILAMTILTMLVGISVVTYNENVEESRHDMALQKLQYLSDAVQRWEMDQNARYPYDNLQPLEGKYIRNLSADPWGSEYQIDSEKGIVYSMGRDAKDDLGSGDDVFVSFDSDRDPPPAAPSNFKVKRLGDDITLTWKDPLVNFDGSKIEGDLKHIKVFYRLSSKVDIKAVPIAPISSGVENRIFDYTVSLPEAEQETVYFYIRAYDFAGNEGPPSDPAGLFVVAKTAPVINLFQASPPRCPLQTPFSVKMDISDGDANLTQVTLSGSGLPDKGCGAGQFVWTTNAGPADQILVNQFHPVLHYTVVPQTPATSFTLNLTVSDTTGNTTSTVLPYKIEFTNDPPRLNTLSPGVHNVTINPSANGSITTHYAEITYLIEAGDGESNITELHLQATYDPDGAVLGGPEYSTNLHKTWTYSGGGVPVAVESFTWNVLPRKAQTVQVEAWAIDSETEESVHKIATLNLSKDKTPPQYLTFWMEPSNPVIENEQFTRWWIKDRTGEGKPANYLEAYAWGWELESKPVTYYCCVSTTSPSNLNNFYAQRVTGPTTGWVSFTQDPTTERGHIELWPNNGFPPAFNFDPTKRYYALVMAKNAVDVYSANSAPPKHKSFKIEQTPFGYDDTRPEITEITIDSLGTVGATSDVWFNGTLSATWKSRDLIVYGDDMSGVGSGSRWWKYRIIREPTPYDAGGAAYVYPDPPGTWEVVDSPEIKDMAMGTDFPIARFIVEIQARDAAGNWSDLVTGAARLDLTPPTTWVGVVPVVLSTSDDGFIHANNTIEASWAGVFYDNESGIESFDWGVSTTRPLDVTFPIPNIVPWQRVGGGTLNQYFTRNDPPLLVDGTDVYVCVRARNFAGQVSETVYSTGYPVDVSMYTDLQAKPRSGFEDMSVEFSVSVTGGKSPFDYTMLFDGSYGDPARMWLETSSTATPYTTSFPYDVATFGAGRHSCVVKVRDADNVQSTMDIYFDLHPAPLFAVILDKTGENFELFHVKGTKLDQIMLGRGPDTNKWQLFSGSERPVAMDLGPNDQFMFITGKTGTTSIYRRWHLAGPRATHSNQVDIEESGTTLAEPRDVVISPDGSFALFSGVGGQKYLHNGWVGRVMLYPGTGRTYGATPWSLGVFTDSTDFSGNAVEIWDGGFSAAVGIFNSNFGGINVKHGICPVDLGQVGVMTLFTDRYFGTTTDVNEYKNIGAIKASPDNKWLAFTSTNSASQQVFVGEAVNMAAGSGAMPCSSDTAGTGFTNPVWAYDSSKFYVAGMATGTVYYVDMSTYPAVSLQAMVDVNDGTAVFPTVATRLDISPEGKYLALCGGSSAWVGTINPGTIGWNLNKGFSDTIVDAQFVQQPKYGGPWISAIGTSSWVSPNWTIPVHGVGFWESTRVTVTRVGETIPVINNLSIAAMGISTIFDELPLVINDPYSDAGATDPTDIGNTDKWTIHLETTVGATIKTTEIVFDP